MPHVHREKGLPFRASGCVVVVVTVNSTQSAVRTKSSEGSSHFPVKFNQEKRGEEVPRRGSPVGIAGRSQNHEDDFLATTPKMKGNCSTV